MVESLEAKALVADLRGKFQVATRASELESTEIFRTPLVPKASATPIVRDGAWLRPRLAAGAAKVEVALADRASRGFHIEDVESKIGLDVTLRGAADVPAEVADGHIVYRNAGPESATLVHTVSETGTEDYLTFERAPDRAEVVYDVALSSADVGLRLVGNTLEVIDGGGAPRLRVAPPYLVGADGARVDAALSVDGCAADRDPAPPWDRPPVPAGATTCQVRVEWNRDAVRYPAMLDPSWASTANMSTPRAFAVSALTPSRVLVAGGWNGSVAHASAELYDWTTRTWAATGSLSTPRMQATATVLGTGRILVAAGTNGAIDLATAELYNPATGTFSATGTMTGARHFHAATLLTNGNVLIAGGRLGGIPQLATAQVYNTATGTWGTTGNMLTAQGPVGLVRLPSGLVLGTGMNAPTAQLYNPATGLWAATGALHTPRQFHTTTLLPNGTVLAVGGRPSAVSLLSAETYSPTTGVWTRTGATPFGHDTGSADVVGGRVIVAGERGSGGLFVQSYDPTWGTWTPLPNLSISRYSHISALMGNGKLLIAGGTLSGTTAAAEELTPSTTPVTTSDYRFAATTDADVLSDRQTELWAAVYRPTTLAAGTTYPVLVLLHGNHGTCGTGSNPRVDSSCQYTTTGTCPAGFVVTPNHLGYGYVATELAARGMIVVSINANRGITCGGGVTGDSGLNLARGRLILKHLQRLSEWNRSVSATPASIGVSLAGSSISAVSASWGIHAAAKAREPPISNIVRPAASGPVVWSPQRSSRPSSKSGRSTVRPLRSSTRTARNGTCSCRCAMETSRAFPASSLSIA